MSQKECVLTKGNVVSNVIFTRESFDPLTSTSCSNGSTGGSSCSSSSLECNSNDMQGSALLCPCADSCKLEPPLKLQHADDIKPKLSPPLKLQSTNSKPSSSPSALRYPRKVEHDNGTVKKSMGLMKLRRQGSHPPAPASRSINKNCHGSFNQAAAARELMASLERLSMKEKTMGMKEEREAQRALLGAGESVRESINAAASSRNGMKAELPLTAKIAAAMDAEGFIGVQEEISLQYNSGVLMQSTDDQYFRASSFKTKSRMSKPVRRPAAATASGDDEEEVRPVAVRKMHTSLSRRRRIILRRLRSSRALLGKIWRKIKRVFSSSSRKHLEMKLLKGNTSKD